MRTTLAIISAALLCRCNKTASLPAYNTDPVVSAYLYAGHTFTMQLSHQQSTSSITYDAPSVDSLAVTIQCGDTVYHLTPAPNGMYSDSTLIVKPGSTYTLSFPYNGKTVTATTTVPALPTSFTQSVTSVSIEQVTTTGSTPGFGPGNQGTPNELTWDYATGAYYVVVVTNTEVSPEKIYDTVSTSTDTGRVFRNSPVTSGSYVINDRMFKYYGTHRIVLYRILPDFSLLYDMSSGTASQSLTTFSTGISNGVGIFTGISSDTLYMSVVKK